MTYAYLTSALPGIGGRIKDAPDDFVVDEIPLYEPVGVGIHCFFTIEKRGISTLQAVNHVAHALGRRSIDIGYAGLKDAQAVTRQTFSIEHEDSDRLRQLKAPHLTVVAVTRHRNKLKVGHLAGNRFVIKIRNDQWTKSADWRTESLHQAQAVAEVLKRDGVPNYFGPQRFGMRKDNHLLGLALLQGNAEEFMRRFLGDPDEGVDHGGVLLARQHFAKGRLDLAFAHWPGHLHQERRALQAMVKSPTNPKRALATVDMVLKRLLVSALQAHLFNQVLDKRLSRLGIILPGDLAWKHDNGSVFAVPDTAEGATLEQSRCDAHEISPSGPMFGYRMTEPQGEPLAMETAVMRDMNLTPASFDRPEAQRAKGGRRAMRFFPKDLDLAPGDDDRGPYLQVSVTLPPGSFATVLLGEIMKSDVAVEAAG